MPHRRVDTEDRSGRPTAWSTTSTPTSSSTAAASSWSATRAGARCCRSSLGGGQDAATNDALQAANEIGAFADVTGLTQPYADALSRNEVINFGRPLHVARVVRGAPRPTRGATSPTARSSAEISTEYANERLLGRTAEFAGGDLAGQHRTMAVIAPNNLEYQQCVRPPSRCDRRRRQRDRPRLDYTLDFATLADPGRQPPGQAQGRGHHVGVLRLRPAHADVPGRARPTAQDYYPEWLIGRRRLHRPRPRSASSSPTRAADQWSRPSAAAPRRRPAAPDERGPRGLHVGARRRAVDLVDLVYPQLLTVALGIQMAGPEPDPRDLRDRAVRLPARRPARRARGTSGPGHYTPVTDIREIWWDPDAVSPFNGEPGTYVDNGQRYTAAGRSRGRPGGVPVKRSHVASSAAWSPPCVLAARSCSPDADARSASSLKGALFGSATGLLAVGLVLTYRTTRIINFAYGAMGSLGRRRGRRPRRGQGRGTGAQAGARSASPPAWSSGRWSSG